MFYKSIFNNSRSKATQSSKPQSESTAHLDPLRKAEKPPPPVKMSERDEIQGGSLSEKLNKLSFRSKKSSGIQSEPINPKLKKFVELKF